MSGDAASDGFGGVGHAAAASARHVDREVTGRRDDEGRVGAAVVDLRTGSRGVGDLCHAEAVLAADRIDDLLGPGDGDIEVVQRGLGERP